MNFNNKFFDSFLCKKCFMIQLITVAKTSEKVLRLNMSESRKKSFIVKRSYNKTVTDISFGLPTFISDIHLGHAASVKIFFSSR